MKKMKEQTYGWYPSVRDVYRSKNQPTPYHLECMYKFQGSGYHNPIVEPPQPHFIVQQITPQPPPSRPSSSYSRQGAQSSAARRTKSVPVPKFRPVPKVSYPTPMQAWGKKHLLAETAWGYGSGDSTPAPRENSAQEEQTPGPEVQWPKQQFVGKYDKPYVPARSAVSTADEVFETSMPPRDPGTGGDSGYVFVPTGDGGVEVHSPPVYWPEHSPRAPSPTRSASRQSSKGSGGYMRKSQVQFQQQEQDERKKVVERQRRYDSLLRQQQIKQQQLQKQTPRTPSGVRRERVKSASIHRAKTPVPQRPAFSARPHFTSGWGTPQPADSHAASEGNTPRQWADEGEGEREGGAATTSPPQRPANPLPPSPSLEDLHIEEDRSPSPDGYQGALDKYGWRAEVPGDPYRIKKTTKRLPYTVQCTEPVLAPEPPQVHMESKETFFLNTIPRRKATFDVHDEWISEGLHAKRIQLQKRDGGVNYRYKTFSFAY